MADPFAIIANYGSQGNAGDAFAGAFKQGQADNRQSMARSAMSALVQDPTNQRALAALAQVDPERAMEFRKTQLQYGDKTHEEWAKTIGLAAKQAKTPQMWDQIVDQFVAQGHPEAVKLKGQFSPALRAAFMAQGGVQDDHAEQDPSMIREFDIATQRGLVPPGTSFQQYATMRNPGMSAPVTIPYGSQVSGGGAPSSAPTATGPNGQKVQYNAQTGQWEPIGGQSPQGSGGFPQ